MSVSKLSYGYAKALISLCSSEDTLKSIRQQVEALSAVCVQSRDFLLFLRSPIVPQYKKISVMRVLFEGTLHALLLSFMILLVRRRRERYLPEVLLAFIALCYERMGVVQATLTLSFSPDEPLLNRFRALVERLTRKKVALKVEVDPNSLGGYKLVVEHRQIDNLVVSRLQRIKRHLT